MSHSEQLRQLTYWANTLRWPSVNPHELINDAWITITSQPSCTLAFAKWPAVTAKFAILHACRHVIHSTPGNPPDRPARPDRRIENLDLLTHLCRNLTPSDYRLIHLYYTEGKSTRQIAPILGVTHAAVSYRLRNLRKRLRKAQHSCTPVQPPSA